jgi:hypothetical protein
VSERLQAKRPPDAVSELTDGIIDEPEPNEYTVPEFGPAYIPNPKKQLKLQNLALQQEEIVILNIGGELFTTFKPTLIADPSSILASLESDASIPTLTGPFHYFLDRLPRSDFPSAVCTISPGIVVRVCFS